VVIFWFVCLPLLIVFVLIAICSLDAWLLVGGLVGVVFCLVFYSVAFVACLCLRLNYCVVWFAWIEFGFVCLGWVFCGWLLFTFDFYLLIVLIVLCYIRYFR